MTDFEKSVTEFIREQSECNGRQEEVSKNIKKDVGIIVKKLNGIDIHKLRDKVDKQGEKLQRIIGAGTLAIIFVPLVLYFIRGLF